ncbi:hypothetical protein WKK05_38355 (plasmid) [Nostoc sp. UHCC 0302]|uniref:hypothetical protein n=1 Tax=Nostoc sp. UHCC 0302 TaxID=3134896 RepID=UPI00311CD3AA
MEMKLSTSEIRAILQGCQYTLRFIGSSKDYRQLQGSPDFSTSNNVYLKDAVNILGEVLEAILEVERIIHDQKESGEGDTDLSESSSTF